MDLLFSGDCVFAWRAEQSFAAMREREVVESEERPLDSKCRSHCTLALAHVNNSVQWATSVLFALLLPISNVAGFANKHPKNAYCLHRQSSRANRAVTSIRTVAPRLYAGLVNFACRAAGLRFASVGSHYYPTDTLPSRIDRDRSVAVVY